MSTGPWLNVLVDIPGQPGEFTYTAPPELPVAPGDLVSVPLGPGLVGGIVLEFLDALPSDLTPAQIRPISEVIHPRFFQPSYWQLLERTATYYYTPLVQVLKTALPPGLLQRSQRRIALTNLAAVPPQSLSLRAKKIFDLLQASPSQDYSWRYIQQKVPRAQPALAELLKQGLVQSYLRPPTHPQTKQQQAVILLKPPTPDLPPRQTAILTHLPNHGGEIWLSNLLQACKTSKSTLKTLEEKGYLTITLRQKLRLETPPLPPSTPRPLTPDQAQALHPILQAQDCQTFLLHGVTGSGKTEVYLQAIRARIAQGYSALVLVPEIGLTPQMVDRFRAVLGDQVLVYHSGLSEGERYDTWHHVLLEQPQVIIGTRSAIFLPLKKLGIIVLDEEHDSGYKQEQPPPCYHAKTLAQWRSQLEHCPLVLGSATPGLETWQQTQRAKITYLTLPQRIHARPLPPIEIIDLREELRHGNRNLLSRTLFTALDTLPPHEQALLFIHRRGHSTFVSCRSCGQALECPHCSVSLTYHQPDTPPTPPLLRCHYCNYSRPQPQRCPSCQSPYLKHFGSGTQRVVQELRDRLPHLKTLRFDSDTTQRKGSHRQLIAAFARGEAQVMIGTQMLTKGMDLASVNLVGILAADGLLHRADYQAGERTFQTLTQVAGRAGRGSQPGRVILQTYTPEHPVIQAVQAYGYQTFAASELSQRQALHYPPWGQLILIRLSSPDAHAVANTATILSTYLHQNLAIVTEQAEILGPAPAPILKVAQRYRWQILLKYPHRRPGQFPPPPLEIQQLRHLCCTGVRLGVDVDPQNFT